MNVSTVVLLVKIAIFPIGLPPDRLNKSVQCAVGIYVPILIVNLNAVSHP